MIQNTLFGTLNPLFVNQMTKNNLFQSIYGDTSINHNIRARRTLSWVGSKWENIKRDVEPLVYIGCGFTRKVGKLVFHLFIQ